MGVLFLDVSNAFDSPDHDVLLRKLENIPLAGNSLNWFKSYLHILQHVRFSGILSGPTEFKYGIPQGSCLGSTLIILYINDVFNAIKICIKVVNHGVMFRLDYRRDWMYILLGVEIITYPLGKQRLW